MRCARAPSSYPALTTRPLWPWSKRVATGAFFLLVGELLIQQAREIEWQKVIAYVALCAFAARVNDPHLHAAPSDEAGYLGATRRIGGQLATDRRHDSRAVACAGG